MVYNWPRRVENKSPLKKVEEEEEEAEKLVLGRAVRRRVAPPQPTPQPHHHLFPPTAATVNQHPPARSLARSPDAGAAFHWPAARALFIAAPHGRSQA